MRNDLIFDTRPLAKGGIRRVHHPLGRRVECVSGALWVTQDGDPRDIVLSPGDSFAFDQRGDALISALDDARFLLLEDLRAGRRTDASYWIGPFRASGSGSATTAMPSSRSASASSLEARPRMPRSSTSP